MYFDSRAAKLLQPGQHLVIGGCPGLRLVASAARKTWAYRYKSPGSGLMKQVSLGQYPGVTVQAAVAEWDKLRAQRAAGVDPGQQRRQSKRDGRADNNGPGALQVQAVVKMYITGHLDPSRTTASALSARRALERLLADEPDFARRPAAQLTRSQAFELLDTRKSTPTAAAKLRALLGAAWDYALDAGKLDQDQPNWWRAVMKGRLKSKGKLMQGKHVGQQRRTLQGAEIGELLRWLPNMQPVAADTTVLYLWTCARGVEILGMQPSHVREEADGTWWTVPKALTKNADVPAAVDLRIPLVGRALEIVQRRMKAAGKSGPMFANQSGEPYAQKAFSTYIYDLQPYSKKSEKRQGDGLVLPITGWSPHNLRRTGRTLLSALGCPQEVAEAIVGHMPAQIVGVYNAYSYDAERRLWLSRLDKHLEALAQSA